MAQSITLPEPVATAASAAGSSVPHAPRSMKTKTAPKALSIKRRFTQAGLDAYELLDFEMRESRITEPDGTVVFEMQNVEVPKTWSQLATDIIAQKYFRKRGVGSGGETSAKQVVHRVGNGGIYFFRRHELKRFHTLRDRIIREVLISLEVAEKVLTELNTHAKEVSWDFEIHADVGENGPTSALIQEVTGIIRASNFTVKTKPDSYAASKVADRHV